VRLQPTTVGKATFSDDHRYRYDLVRCWPKDLTTVADLCLWVMLNPSSAGADTDDPTVRKCQGFARRWGFGGIVVVNLFGLVATDPTALVGHPAPVGRDTDLVISEWLDDPQVGAVIEAWGAHPFAASSGRATEVGATVRAAKSDLVWRLGSTKSGAPKHPLYVPYTTNAVAA